MNLLFSLPSFFDNLINGFTLITLIGLLTIHQTFLPTLKATI